MKLKNEEIHKSIKWEKIEQESSTGNHSYRSKVPGGWIVRLVSTGIHPATISHVFLPDKKHEWLEETVSE